MKSPNKKTDEAVGDGEHRLAEAIRAACIQAALQGYADAAVSGLCHEGAWECAVDAMRALDVAAIIRAIDPSSSP